jgi:hypothetical protein
VADDAIPAPSAWFARKAGRAGAARERRFSAQCAPMPFAATQPLPAAVPRWSLVPARTAAGRLELNERSRALTQRQRTVLFLVDGSTAFAELVAMGLVAAPGLSVDGDSTSLMPSSHSLHGDSNWSALPEDIAAPGDRPLDEARSLLMRAVRSEAPVAGTLTLLRLKRATTREALAALLDEVEHRLRKPHRRIIAAQTLRHVRHLLTLPAASRPPAG